MRDAAIEPSRRDRLSADGGSASTARYGVLLESIVGDLQWCALHIATVAMLINAGARQGDWRLVGPWRRVFEDDGDPTLLALRYRAEIGLPVAVAERIAGLYANFAAAKRAARRLPAGDDQAGSPRRSEISQACVDWRRLAGEAGETLAALAPLTNHRLDGVYAADAATLGQFLAEAASGQTERVNATGEITLPTFTLRRRTRRAE